MEIDIIPSPPTPTSSKIFIHASLTDLVHYTSTGEGSILTVDQRTGSLLWTLELPSPLVAMYLLGPDGEEGKVW